MGIFFLCSYYLKSFCPSLAPFLIKCHVVAEIGVCVKRLNSNKIFVICCCKDYMFLSLVVPV